MLHAVGAITRAIGVENHIALTSVADDDRALERDAGTNDRRVNSISSHKLRRDAGRVSVIYEENPLVAAFGLHHMHACAQRVSPPPPPAAAGANQSRN